MLFSKCCISRRWEMVFLMFSGILIVYTLRVNMSVAAQKMRDDLNWTEAQKGFVLSSFYWGYAIGQLPAAWLTQRNGAKWIFGFSVLIPSFLTILVPAACRISYELALFIRMAIGFFESATFPCVFYFFPIWIPPEEKSILIPLTTSGMYVGSIIGFSFSGYLVSSDIFLFGQNVGGWPSVFYVFGLAGILWFPIWLAMAHESPDVHPGITKEELLIFHRVRLGNENCDSSVDQAKPLLLQDDDLEFHSAETMIPVYAESERGSDSTGSGIGSASSVTKRNSSSSNNNNNNNNIGQQRSSGSSTGASGSSGNLVAVSLLEEHLDCAVANSGKAKSVGAVVARDGYKPVVLISGSSETDQMRTVFSPLSPSFSSVEPASSSVVGEAINNNNSNARRTSRSDSVSNVQPVAGETYFLSEESYQQDFMQYNAPRLSTHSRNSSHSYSQGQTRNEIRQAKSELAARIPWGKFFTHPVALTLLFNQMTFGWTGFLLLSEMPAYLTDVLGFDLESAGVLCIFPFIALFLATVAFGYTFFHLQHYYNWRVRSVRLAAQAVGLTGSSVCLIACGFIRDNRYLAYIFLIFALAFSGACQSGVACSYTDIAPTFSSSLNTLANTIGAVAGILGPIVVAVMTDTWPEDSWGWKATFFLTGLLSVISIFLWARFVQSEIVPALNSPVPKRDC